MTVAIEIALRGNKSGRHWESIVGYTLKEFKQDFESKFTSGMSWSNMSLWHIDHIIPKSLFQYEISEDREFKQCWALANLQPLWKSENLKKHNKP